MVKPSIFIANDLRKLTNTVLILLSLSLSFEMLELVSASYIDISSSISSLM